MRIPPVCWKCSGTPAAATGAPCVLLQVPNFLLVALDHSLDHGFRVQSAGQSGDDVGISVSINASAGGAASQASDRCHVSFTPLTRLSPQDSTVID